MRTRTLILLYSISRIVDFVIVYFAAKIVPFQNRFTFDDKALPALLRSFAHYDGVIYSQIADRGYQEVTEYAFFPLFPFLINIFQYFFGGTILYAGLFISTVAFLGSMILINKYLIGIRINPSIILWTFLFLLFFPTSFFFHSVYTESLFLFLLIACLYSLHLKKYFLTFVFGYFVALTRFVGVFVIVPFLIHLFSEYLRSPFFPEKKQSLQKHISSLLPFLKKNYFLAIILLAPLLGLMTFSLYLYLETGDPLKFIHAQYAFGEQRASSFILPPQTLYRYIKIFVTADLSFVYFVASVEFVSFITVFGVLIFTVIKNYKKNQYRYLLALFGSFSLINILLSTFTGSLTSIPRFALISVLFFVSLAYIKNTPIKISILIIFFLFHIILLSLFSQGYFVS